MNITQLKMALPILFKHKIPVQIWGQQGIGKTEVIKQVGAENGYDSVIHLNMGTFCDMGDIIGLQVVNPDGTTTHLPPKWFPKTGKHIVFLDEINRAHADILQGLFTLVLEGRLHTYKLPEGSVVVCASNYQTNQFNVTDTSDAAWMSRFCHIDLQPSVAEFVDYMESKGNFMTAEFIRAYPQMMQEEHKERFDFNKITPDMRSHDKMISPLDNEPALDSVRFELYSGIIGKPAAAARQTWAAKRETVISCKEVLNSFEKVQGKIKKLFKKDESRFDAFSNVIEEMALYCGKNKLTSAQLDNLQLFLLEVPLELGLKAVKLLSPIPQIAELFCDKEFVSRFEENKLKGKNASKKVAS